MPSFDVAHIHEQGQDMIIIPLDDAFDYKPSSVQNDTMRELQLRANAAGLRGTVVLVWEASGGRMKFMAPQQWHPFFRSIDMYFVLRNVNREISW